VLELNTTEHVVAEVEGKTAPHVIAAGDRRGYYKSQPGIEAESGLF